MRKIIATLLALVLTALATNSAQAAVATWEHFGADKAYTSREAAIVDAPKVLKRVGYPEPVIALLTEAMKNPGTGTYVTNGMKFDFMRSGKDALWRNVLVKFTKPPIKERMEYSAPAEEWSVDWNEKKWTVVLPAVCFNLLGKPTSVSPVVLAPPAKALTKPVVTATCPKGIVVFANAWTMEAICKASPELCVKVKAAIAAAAGRDSENASNINAYKADDVSGSLGDEIIRAVGVRAPVGVDITAQLLDPVTLKQVDDLGSFRLIDGIASIHLKEIPRDTIVQTIWPNFFSSPTMSGGARRIWVLPGSWEKKGGGRWCTLQINAVYEKENRP